MNIRVERQCNIITYATYYVRTAHLLSNIESFIQVSQPVVDRLAGEKEMREKERGEREKVGCRDLYICEQSFDICVAQLNANKKIVSEMK